VKFSWRRHAAPRSTAAVAGAVFWVLAAVPAVAQDVGDIYTVTGVAVDATGASAAEARDIALAEGQAAAAARMLQRLTLEPDWPMLPPMSPQAAQALVTGVGVANERASSTRYLADLTVRFQREAVRSLLRQSGVRFTDNQAAPALLLPVLDADGMRVLFDEPNPWRSAWDARDLANSLVPLVLPLGDLNDLTEISAEDAVIADWPAVAPLAARYRTSQVLVAHARWRDGAGLDVTLIRLTPSGREATERSYGGATLAEAVAVAAAATQEALLASWKANNAIVLGLEQTLPASVEFASLSEWLTIRERLAATSIVQDLSVVAISPRGAQIEMRVAGPAEMVAGSVGQRQLRMVWEDGYWTITIAEPALQEPFPGASAPPGGAVMPADAGAAMPAGTAGGPMPGEQDARAQ